MYCTYNDIQIVYMKGLELLNKTKTYTTWNYYSSPAWRTNTFFDFLLLQDLTVNIVQWRQALGRPPTGAPVQVAGAVENVVFFVVDVSFWSRVVDYVRFIYVLCFLLVLGSGSCLLVVISFVAVFWSVLVCFYWYCRVWLFLLWNMFSSLWGPKDTSVYTEALRVGCLLNDDSFVAIVCVDGFQTCWCT